jgi:antitoxin PrlF
MPKITSKGQVTIPKRIREYLGLKPGSEVDFQYAGDGRITLKSAEGTGERIERERKRLKKALAELRGSAKFGMTTEELMQLTRGWGEPDYDVK